MCHRCGTAWRGYGSQPRPREICEGCGSYLRCCENCQHFDRSVTRKCQLEGTVYIGSRTALNYCEEYSIFDSRRQAAQERVQRARSAWEALFE